MKKTYGNSFKINDLDLNNKKAILCIQDSANEDLGWRFVDSFLGEYPFGFIGTPPWHCPKINQLDMDLVDDVNLKITSLFAKVADCAVVLYCLDSQTKHLKEYINYVVEQFPNALHVLCTVPKEVLGVCGNERVVDMRGRDYADIVSLCKTNVDSSSVARKYTNREPVEWANFSFVKEENDKKLLLVGDSISRAYAVNVRKAMSEYDVDTLNTSEGTEDKIIYDELELMLQYRKYDVVHINNGIHLHGITNEQYEQNLSNIFDFIRKLSPQIKIVYATTTTVSKKKDVEQGFNASEFKLGGVDPVKEVTQTAYTEYDEEATQRYIELNAIAKKICEQKNIEVDDLFEVCLKENLPKRDVVHFTPEGYEALTKEIVKVVGKL